MHRLFDRDGLCSSSATRQLIELIEVIHPDVIHLHNIHDHWLNYEGLINYLTASNVPVIWTQHDCWSFTGGCFYYTLVGCNQWKDGCERCPLKRKALPLIDNTKKQYTLRKQLLKGAGSITFTTVSHWLEGELRQSFLKGHRIVNIYNGVDLDVFSPRESDIKKRLGIEGLSLLVGVAVGWGERKGFNDYLELREKLPRNIVLLLVGMDKKQMKTLPEGIIGLSKTQNVTELASIYSGADIVLNLSHAETFGLTTVEGLASGTPGIVYDCTASPELLTHETGFVVEEGNIEGVANAVVEILRIGKSYYTVACRKRAEQLFDKNKRNMDYINLYEEVRKS